MGEGEVLSQGEVDALLRGVGDGEVDTETDQGPEDETGVVGNLVKYKVLNDGPTFSIGDILDKTEIQLDKIKNGNILISAHGNSSLMLQI